MVTTEQIKNGVQRFVTNEIINKLQISPNSIRYGLIVAGINLWVSHNVDSMLSDATVEKSLGIVDENGHYDIHKIAEAFKQTMQDTGYRIDLRIAGFDLGNMTFYRSDVDNLVQHIVNA